MYQYSEIFLSTHYKGLFLVCRLRIEEVEELIIDSVTLRPNDEVDFWFTNIRQNFSMTGTRTKIPKVPKSSFCVI